MLAEMKSNMDYLHVLSCNRISYKCRCTNDTELSFPQCMALTAASDMVLRIKT